MPAPAAAPAPADPPRDASYDWRSLVIVPFGSALKELPFAVHDALLFHESQAAAAAETDERDCFTRDEPPPKFIGVIADDFVLCFHRDRLVRIEVAVSPAGVAAQDSFERLCDHWLSGAETIVRGPGRCEGRDADMLFSAEIDAAGGLAGASTGTQPAWVVIVRDAADRGEPEQRKH